MAVQREILGTHDDICKRAAREIAELVKCKPHAVLGRARKRRQTRRARP